MTGSDGSEGPLTTELLVGLGISGTNGGVSMGNADITAAREACLPVSS